MTTTWPVAPSGGRWRDLDGILDTVDTMVRSEARAGSVHQVRWDPADGTRVAFERVDGDTVVLEASGRGVSVRRLGDDEALPGLAEMLDPESVRSRLQGLLPHPVERCAVTVVSYRPGSRCVVRYAVRGGRNEGSLLYGKVLAQDADVCLENHDVLSVTLGRRVPRLVAVWPDLAALVTEAVPGRSASAVLSDAATSPRARRALAQELGTLLAAFHGTAPGPMAARRLHSEAIEVGELEGYLDTAWQADAEAALSMGWLVRELSLTRPTPGRPVLGHGSFRAGQVVVNGRDLVVLDLDSAGAAAPERDLGNALAYLDWWHLRHPRARGEDLSAGVVEGYLGSGGEIDPDRLAWWHAASLAKIAGRRYRSLDTAHWAAVPSLLNAARGVQDFRAVLHAGQDPSAPTAPGRLQPGSGAEVTDGRAMSRILREVLDHLGTTAEDAIAVTDSSTIRVAAGRRVVERYRLSGTLQEHGEIILKAYAEPERAAIAHENLGVFAALTDPVTRVGTPAPVGHLPDRGIVVCRAVSGRTVTELTDEGADDAAARCGRWLRDVHGSGAVLARRLDLSREVSNLAMWSEEIARADARLAEAARTLAERLALVATRMPLIRSAAIHKDLHLDHVIVDASGWAWVIDLDEARMGDPAFDVAHLSAYAEEAGARRAGEAFVAAYGDLEGPDVTLRLAYFHAYTLLKITKQRVRAHGDDDEQAERSAARLARGVSWLGE
ncbi:MAG: aminoglycoside phosphotransferase family protein [Dermatophilaceae bacterium]